MKPFRFTLQAVLTVRQRHERLAMAKYAQAWTDAQHDRERLAVVEAEWTAACAKQRQLFERGCTAAEMSHSHQYNQQVEARRQLRATEVQVAEGRVRDARQTMIESRRQREVVDKSYARQRRVHDLEATRAEQKVLDELGQRRLSHSSSASSILGAAL